MSVFPYPLHASSSSLQACWRALRSLQSLSCRDGLAQGGEEGVEGLTVRWDVRFLEAVETGLVSGGEQEDLRACNTVLETWGLGHKCLGHRENKVGGTS